MSDWTTNIMQLREVETLDVNTETQKLAVRNSPKLASINQLSQLTNLTELYLIRIPRIIRVRCLTECIQLRKLVVTGCPQISDLHLVVPQLEYLDLDCPSLIREPVTCPDLTTLRVLYDVSITYKTIPVFPDPTILPLTAPALTTLELGNGVQLLGGRNVTDLTVHSWRNLTQLVNYPAVKRLKCISSSSGDLTELVNCLDLEESTTCEWLTPHATAETLTFISTRCRYTGLDQLLHLSELTVVASVVDYPALQVIQNCPALRTLTLDDVELIESLRDEPETLPNLTGLTTINIYDPRELADLDWCRNCSNLESLTITANNLRLDIPVFPRLRELTLGSRDYETDLVEWRANDQVLHTKVKCGHPGLLDQYRTAWAIPYSRMKRVDPRYC